MPYDKGTVSSLNVYPPTVRAWKLLILKERPVLDYSIRLILLVSQALKQVAALWHLRITIRYSGAHSFGESLDRLQEPSTL